MKLSVFLTSIVLICASLAAPRGSPRQHDGSIGQFVFPVWYITNFDSGCSLGGCISKEVFRSLPVLTIYSRIYWGIFLTYTPGTRADAPYIHGSLY